MLIKITNFIPGTTLRPGIVLNVEPRHPSTPAVNPCVHKNAWHCPLTTLVVIDRIALCPVHDYTTL